jgi:hypothetical protein
VEGTNRVRLERKSRGQGSFVASSLGSVLAVTSPPTNSTTAAFNSRITDKILRVGVNYKFDPYDIWGE